MKIMFMGTPDIAVPCLEALAAKYDVVCAVTQPDKPKGRGNKISAPAVKEKAIELGIDVCQPATLRDGAFKETLDKYSPDVIVVVAYGKILPKYVLDYPAFGCINVHASLLPKYRGASPIQWAVVNGEKVSGVTTMLMNEGLDTGGMLLKEEIPITGDMTAGNLHEKMCAVCPEILIKTLDNIKNIKPEKQDDHAACYAPLLTKEMCFIDWSKSAEEIHNLIRGMNPFPTARINFKGKIIKIYESEISDLSGKPGEVLDTSKGLTVACGSGSITITSLQPEGKRRMQAEDFLLGCKIQKGEML